MNWEGERALCSGAGVELRGGGAGEDALVACLPARTPGAWRPGSPALLAGRVAVGVDGGEDIGRLVGRLDVWACLFYGGYGGS